ncbi:MAG: hypothetical protein MUE85_15245 [Microscillaceae bacterium]|jgi:hypothetical protein|nr:hypothetical protein [Microscillaceae bacterium]
MKTTKIAKEYKPQTINPTQLNIYNPKEIMSVGGIEIFSKMIGNDKPIQIPSIEFTQEEWDEIERLLNID